MGLGFARSEEKKEEEPVCLYRRIIECPLCEDKGLNDLYKGACSCGNITIDVLEPISRERYNRKYNWKHFKSIKYEKEAPLIYEVLRDERP
jgi:hypothetical protein